MGVVVSFCWYRHNLLLREKTYKTKLFVILRAVLCMRNAKNVLLLLVIIRQGTFNGGAALTDYCGGFINLQLCARKRIYSRTLDTPYTHRLETISIASHLNMIMFS